MTETTTPAPEVPAAQQLAHAQANADHTTDLCVQARDALHETRGVYALARTCDPAAQATEHARHAWSQALADWADAQVAMEKARDELTALHRESTAEGEA